MNDLTKQIGDKISDKIFEHCDNVSLITVYVNSTYNYIVIDLGFSAIASATEIQETIDYIVEITECKEIKISVGLFKDYSITLKKYNLNRILKEIVFEN